MKFQTVGDPYNVYVSFLSVPTDVRRVSVCDALSIAAFDTLVRDTFSKTYTSIPDELLYYVRKRLRDCTTGVLCESVKGYMSPDCIVYVFPLNADLEDRQMPTEVCGRVEKRALGLRPL